MGACVHARKDDSQTYVVTASAGVWMHILTKKEYMGVGAWVHCS